MKGYQLRNQLCVGALALCLLCGCGPAAETGATPPAASPPPAETAPSIFYEDAVELLELAEAAHPAFSLGDVPESYWQTKEQFLAASQHAKLWTPTQFYWEAMVCLSQLGDGHTTLYPTDTRVLPVSWAAVGAHLYLLDEAGALTGQEVTAICEIPVEQVFAVIDGHFPQENQAAREKTRTKWSRTMQLLRRAGYTGAEADCTVTVDGQTGSVWDLAAPMQPQEEDIISHTMLEDVFYVDFNSCTPGPEVDGTAAAMATALQEGTTRFIIDVRGNGGGNSLTCNQLLEALDMEVPGYGCYERYSPLSHQQNGTPDHGEQWYERSPASARSNPAVRLAVLTDAASFSSATMLAVFVQDGGLGTIIGTPSSNSPSTYGDVLSFQLTNTGLMGQVSYKQWLRPDEHADQRTLWPDIQTEVGEDALQAALEFLQS